MTLEDAIRIVLPVPAGACRLARMRIEAERYAIKKRIEQKELHLVPKNILTEIEKIFGELK